MRPGPSDESALAKSSCTAQGEVNVVANGSGTGRSGLAAFLTAVAVIGLIAFVAIAIDSYDTGEDVQAVGAAASPAATGSGTNTQAAPQSAPPVGGVATGGGGTATGTRSLAGPAAGALAALTLLAAAQMVGRPRRA